MKKIRVEIITIISDEHAEELLKSTGEDFANGVLGENETLLSYIVEEIIE